MKMLHCNSKDDAVSCSGLTKAVMSIDGIYKKRLALTGHKVCAVIQ